MLRTASLGGNFTGSYKKKEMKDKGNPNKINELILKMKACLKKRPDIIVIVRLSFHLISYLSFRERGFL